MKWIGYEIPTEEPFDNLREAIGEVIDFHKANPGKPCPAIVTLAIQEENELTDV